MLPTTRGQILAAGSVCAPMQLDTLVVLPDGRLVRCPEVPDHELSQSGHVDGSGIYLRKAVRFSEVPSECGDCFARRYCDQWCLNPQIRTETYDCIYFRDQCKSFFSDLVKHAEGHQCFSVKYFRIRGIEVKAVSW